MLARFIVAPVRQVGEQTACTLTERCDGMDELECAGAAGGADRDCLFAPRKAAKQQEVSQNRKEYLKRPPALRQAALSVFAVWGNGAASACVAGGAEHFGVALPRPHAGAGRTGASAERAKPALIVRQAGRTGTAVLLPGRRRSSRKSLGTVRNI